MVARRRRPAEAQCTRSPGLGYKLCAVIPVAGQRTHGTTFRALEVTSRWQHRGPSLRSLYDCPIHTNMPTNLYSAKNREDESEALFSLFSSCRPDRQRAIISPVTASAASRGRTCVSDQVPERIDADKRAHHVARAHNTSCAGRRAGRAANLGVVQKCPETAAGELTEPEHAAPA